MRSARSIAATAFRNCSADVECRGAIHPTPARRHPQRRHHDQRAHLATPARARGQSLQARQWNDPGRRAARDRARRHHAAVGAPVGVQRGGRSIEDRETRSRRKGVSGGVSLPAGAEATDVRNARSMAVRLVWTAAEHRAGSRYVLHPGPHRGAGLARRCGGGTRHRQRLLRAHRRRRARTLRVARSVGYRVHRTEVGGRRVSRLDGNRDAAHHAPDRCNPLRRRDSNCGACSCKASQRTH